MDRKMNKFLIFVLQLLNRTSATFWDTPLGLCWITSNGTKDMLKNSDYTTQISQIPTENEHQKHQQDFTNRSSLKTVSSRGTPGQEGGAFPQNTRMGSTMTPSLTGLSGAQQLLLIKWKEHGTKMVWLPPQKCVLYFKPDLGVFFLTRIVKNLGVKNSYQ